MLESQDIEDNLDSYQIIKILKIKQNDIEEIFDFGNKWDSIEKISNDIFLMVIKEKSDKPIQNFSKPMFILHGKK